MSPASTTTCAGTSAGANGSTSRGKSGRNRMGISPPLPPRLQGSAAPGPQLRGDSHPQRVEANEPGGIRLVVGAAVVLEGGDRRIEQRVVVRLPARDHHIALVELEPYAPVYVRLGRVDHR